MNTTRASRGGFTFVEILAAVLITAVGLVGIFSLFAFALGQIQNAHETTVAGQIARADLEKAKTQGFFNLPESSTFTTLTYTRPDGAVSAVRWTGPVSFYDSKGTRQNITAANDLTRFTLQRTVLEVGVVVSGTTYDFRDGGQRIVTATIRRQPENEIMMSMATTLVQGGI